MTPAATTMHHALLCLGSNAPDARRQLARACAMLIGCGHVAVISPPYPTAPEYAGVAASYLNRIVLLRTPLAHDALHALTKAYEAGPRSRRTDGLVAIDIDIVYFDDAVMRPRDAAAAYFRRGIELIANLKSSLHNDIRPHTPL